MNKFYDAISYNQLKIPVYRYKWLSIMSYQLDVSLIMVNQNVKNLYWCEFTCKSGEIKKYIYSPKYDNLH